MPRGSMLKFFAERGGAEHGGHLFWPGTPDGFPFRGEVAPHLKQEELHRIELALDFKSKMFCLWEPEEKAQFDQVMDRIVNGWYMQHRREDTWDKEHKHYRIWLEWVQIYGETPTGKHPAITTGSRANGNRGPTTIRPGQPRRGLSPIDLGLPPFPQAGG